MKHTEKIWEYSGNSEMWSIRNAITLVPILRGKGDIREKEPQLKRIVDCVNGCAGIKNPLAVGKMLEALEIAVDMLRAAGCTATVLNPLEESINKANKEANQ